jgi:hypothetical protein
MHLTLPFFNLDNFNYTYKPNFRESLILLPFVIKLTNSMELSTTLEATRVRPLDSFPAFHGTRRFNTEFTRALHLFLS